MSHSLLLRGARQLLTLRGEPSVRCGPQSGNLEVIEDGSVFIQGGKIVSVGPTRRLENLKEISGAIKIPVHNCIVMPGFVDASINLTLSTPDGAARKRRRLSDFYTESLALLRSCLQHGTLNAGVTFSSGIHSNGADLSVLRQLARIGENPIGITRTWSPPAEPSDDWEAVAKHRLTDSIAFGATDPRLTHAAKKRLKVYLNGFLGSTSELVDYLSASSAMNVFCRHSLSAEERQALVKNKSTAIFKVEGALLDRQPCGSVRELLDEGGAIALGSGYDALYEPNFNMQLVLALAVRRLGLTIEEAIVAATINSAYAMHRGDQIGSLEPGKRADLLVLNLSDYREIPRRLGVNHVAMAIRNGEIAINRTRWRVGAA